VHLSLDHPEGARLVTLNPALLVADARKRLEPVWVATVVQPQYRPK
jgi:hypothetical protein